MAMDQNLDMRHQHEMRPECAREFGKLSAEAKAHSEFRAEVRADLAELKTQLADLADIKEMLAEHIGQSTGGWQRIETLENHQSKLEDRMWGERLKSGGIVGILILAIQFLIKTLSQGAG